MGVLLVGLLLLFTILLFIIGLFSPKAGLFWYKGKRTRLKVLGIYSLLIVLWCCSIGLLGREPTPNLNDVYKEYRLNAPRAHMAYDNKIVNAEGKVLVVTFDTISNKTLVLIHGIICIFKDQQKAAVLKEGNYVHFTGTVGVPIGMGVFTIVDCEFKKINEKKEAEVEKPFEFPSFNFEATDTISTFNQLEGYTPSVNARDFVLSMLTDSTLISSSFKDKEVNVKGVIYDIRWREFEGAFVVDLYGYRESSISCLFPKIDDVLNLNVGETISVKGNYIRKYWSPFTNADNPATVDIYMDNCSVTKSIN